MGTPSRESFQQPYSDLLEAADIFAGGDSQNKVHGGAHEIIDYDVRPEGPSALYHTDEAALLRAKGGVGDETRDAVKTLVRRYNLLDLRRAVREASSGLEEGRRGMINRTATAAHLRVADAYGQAAGTQRPSFDEFYGSVTNEAPALTDLSEPRAVLMQALKRAGSNDVTDATLLDTVDRWKAQHAALDEASANAYLLELKGRVIDLTRDRILNAVHFGMPAPYGDHAEGADFTNLTIQAQDLGRYSAFSLFTGGEKPEGSAASHGIFAVNTAHTSQMRRTGLDHVFAHEGFPGHHLQNVIIDLLRRHNKLGYEASMGTMATPFHVLQEGWAQTVWEILAGGGMEQVADEFGPDMAVELALVAFQDCAKHDASIHHQLNGMSTEDLQAKLAADYFLSPDLVKKISGGWAKDRLFGSTVGSTYLKGRQKIQRAVRDHGVQKVLPFLLHTQGVVADAPYFEEQVGRLSA